MYLGDVFLVSIHNTILCRNKENQYSLVDVEIKKCQYHNNPKYWTDRPLQTV